ncbi:MAG: hypothetical protein M5U17_13260 [Ignavibacterium sp.]|nr:hypothetical protein [Ignavibacterium sp.]
MINDTNLFHVMMNPAIEELYECFVYQNQILHIPETSYTYKARNAIISTVPIENSKKIEPRSIYKEWFIKKNLFLKLSNSNDLFDFNYRWSEFTSNKSIVKKKEYSFLPQFRIQIINSNGELFLAIEPSIRLYSKLSLQFLKEKELINSLITPKHRCIVFVEKEDKRKWMSGVIHDINDETAKVEVPELFLGTIKVNLTRVIPRLGFEILGGIANTNIREEFNKSKLKFYSNQKEILENFYKDHLSPIFPLDIGNSKVLIKSQTIKLSELSQIQMSPKNATYFFVERNDQKVEGTKRLTTLSQISIRDNFIILPIVLFAPESELNFLDKVVMNLNDGIKKGNFKFSMTERFGVKLFVNDRFKTNNDKQYDDKINQFVNSIDKRHTDSLPIIYLSENSPLYYPIKAKLASYGKVSQVISKHNEDDIYSLWNLATNLYAKMGNTPWGNKRKRNRGTSRSFFRFFFFLY